jgi:hypothetical protein
LRRNCLLKHVIEGKIEGRIEVTGRRGRRRKQLLDDLKEKKKYWDLKEKALDRILCGTRFEQVMTSRKTDCGMHERAVQLTQHSHESKIWRAMHIYFIL